MRDDAFVTHPGAGREASNTTARLVHALARAAPEREPCEYIYMTEVFAPDFYREMQARLPDKRHFHKLRHKDAMRPDGSSTRLRMYLYPERLWMLPAQQRHVWLEVSRALLAPELHAAFLRKFASSLTKRFGGEAERLSFFPVPILLCDLPGYRIGIHADATSKAITVQFYLPRDTSQSHLGTVFHDGRDGEAAARTRRLPYLPATGYAFPVMPRESWHSVPQTEEADGDRYSLMLTYYVQDTPGAWLKRRYDRARCFFGVGPKG
jgi:hypothetical protein